MGKKISLIVLILLIVSACVPVSTPTQAVPVPPTAGATPDPPTATPLPTPIRVDLTPAQRAALNALETKQNLSPADIQLVSTEAISWPDGCLGVLLPGVLCIRGPVEGFKIVLSAAGRQYEYHTNQDGTSVLEAVQQLATIRLVVQGPDNSVQLVTPSIPLGPTYDPAFNGLLSDGAALAGNAYVLDFSQLPKAVSVDSNGVQELAFIKDPNYGLALWRGGPNVQPRLAWGTQPINGAPSSLQTSALDGSQLEMLATQAAGSNLPIQLVALAWSADGQTLYFSKEPIGIGGYIPFSGASSLYQIDIGTKKVTELIPFNVSTRFFGCLDALSGDYRFVADHCTPNTITIRDLSSGASSSIQPPASAAGARLLGSARFSPDGKRLAFALAVGDPNVEQGWVAVSDGTGGASRLILTGQPGLIYTVIGWLDDQTVLVQSKALKCDPTCTQQLWMLGIDGSNPVKVADGSFLAMIDNR